MMLGFVEHLLALPYSFFQQRSSGDLLARVASTTWLREILSNQLLSTVLDSGLVVFYLVILLWQSPPFGLLTLVIGLLQVLLLLASNRPISNLARRELAAFGKSQGYLVEALVGIATLKASGAEHRAFDRWSNLFFDQLNISLRQNYVSATMTTILTALRSLAQLALLWVGAVQVLNGSITLGTMVALNALAGAFFAPLASLVSSGQQFQLVAANLDRISDVTEAEPEQQGQEVQLPPRLTGHIQLEHVSFRYAPDAPEVLRQLDLTVEAGQRVAIVGPSGSGKSTLGKLLLGLCVPTEGTIFYDGIPLQRLNCQEVRRQFGVVLQESILFSGSILSNITLSNPTMSKEQVVEAAQIAAIHEDIMSMPMGYDTFVSEGGSALSGGQRQRLAIARAIAQKPTILLLDEATSHLDVVTEQRVAQNLQTLACTQVIIAHRLSTIRNADMILVLDQGIVVEKGSHHELLQRDGYYARLMHQQLEHGEGANASSVGSEPMTEAIVRQA
jgi:ABC-type bacteriocin/lantibiotic exporter with double-glycine peptidase domain